MHVNPVTGTSAVDGQTSLPTNVPWELRCTVDGVEHTFLVVTLVPEILHACAQADPDAPLGAIMVVINRGVKGVPEVKVYKTLLHALRGEGYAKDYYTETIPSLEVMQGDALWALRMVHDSEDLTDQALVFTRDRKLRDIIAELGPSVAERKRLAVSDAERAQLGDDVLARKNPMAAAMANWGLTVQLGHLVESATGHDQRISRTLLAIVQVLADDWKIFRDIIAELASMKRYWRDSRSVEFTLDQAKRLAVRVDRIAMPLQNMVAAPYGQMPILALLKKRLIDLSNDLKNESGYKLAFPLLLEASRTSLTLLVHASIAKALTIPARARRLECVMTPSEQLELLRELVVAMEMIDEVGENVLFGDVTIISITPVVHVHIESAQNETMQLDPDLESIYKDLSSALDLFN